MTGTAGDAASDEDDETRRNTGGLDRRHLDRFNSEKADPHKPQEYVHLTELYSSPRFAQLGPEVRREEQRSPRARRRAR